MAIYLIPGLGYDCRIFDKLDLARFNPVCIEWIEPYKKESLTNYALRLFENYYQENDEIILIGHSMGGIVSQEIAKHYNVKKIILLASIKSNKELPRRFNIINRLRLDRILFKEISLATIRWWGKKHGFTTNENVQLFKSMVAKHSNHYLKWALLSLCQWQGSEKLNAEKIIQIHGTNDKTFPYHRIVNPDFTIENGSHIFPLNQSQLTSRIIRSTLQIADT